MACLLNTIAAPVIADSTTPVSAPLMNCIACVCRSVQAAAVAGRCGRLRKALTYNNKCRIHGVLGLWVVGFFAVLAGSVRCSAPVTSHLVSWLCSCFWYLLDCS